MRILFIGDIVGPQRPRRRCSSGCPRLVRDWKLDFVAVNGENAAGGFGITEAIYQELVDAGADAITVGNHSWDQKEALVFIERAPQAAPPDQLSRPARRAAASALLEAKNGARVLVVNAMGRIFMDPLDDPFRGGRARAWRPVRSSRRPMPIIVDIHAEATSEKQAMGHFCDGRASLVVGTHTHAPTADHRILPRGTAFISDVGMTGDYDSVIGMDKDEPMKRFLRKIPGARFEPAMRPGDAVRARGRDRRRDRARAAHRGRAPGRPARGGAADVLGLRPGLRLAARPRAGGELPRALWT